jgi:hypothetical protein
MKNTKLFIGCILILNNSFAQNVGIGTTTPTLGKLEIKGAAGTGTTVAAFGTDGAGLSIQKDALGPIIGFNHYRDLTIANSQGKHFANGYAGILAQEVANGKIKFDMYDLGVKDGFTSIGRRALTIFNNGNVGLLGEALSNATLYVPKRTNLNGSAYFDGTNYPSVFQYSANEDTYIRGGKNGSKVFINDIPNGDVEIGQVGVGETKVGINITPRATLDVNGDMAMKKLVTVTSTSNTITGFNRQGSSILYFTTTANSITTSLAGIAGGVDGMIIHIVIDYPNGSFFSGFNILDESTSEPNPSNSIITGNGNQFIRGSGGCTLIYDGNTSRWRMIGIIL